MRTSEMIPDFSTQEIQHYFRMCSRDGSWSLNNGPRSLLLWLAEKMLTSLLITTLNMHKDSTYKAQTSPVHPVLTSCLFRIITSKSSRSNISWCCPGTISQYWPIVLTLYHKVHHRWQRSSTHFGVVYREKKDQHLCVVLSTLCGLDCACIKVITLQSQICWRQWLWTNSIMCARRCFTEKVQQLWSI